MAAPGVKSNTNTRIMDSRKRHALIQAMKRGPISLFVEPIGKITFDLSGINKDLLPHSLDQLPYYIEDAMQRIFDKDEGYLYKMELPYEEGGPLTLTQKVEHPAIEEGWPNVIVHTLDDHGFEWKEGTKVNLIHRHPGSFVKGEIHAQFSENKIFVYKKASQFIQKEVLTVGQEVWDNEDMFEKYVDKILMPLV